MVKTNLTFINGSNYTIKILFVNFLGIEVE